MSKLGSRKKGPLVFLDYDQRELDAAYDQAAWAHNQREVGQRVAQKNAAARRRLGEPRRFSYGDTDAERLDVYTTQQLDAPIGVYIHGGSWRFGDAAGCAYQAEMYVDRGAHFIALDFTNVVATEGDMRPLAEQVRRGVAWVYEHAERFGGDRDRIYVSGHSSGGHLAAVVHTTDWHKDYGLPRDVVKGGICASGMYDLYPVALSSRREYVTLPTDVVEALSPMRHIDRISAPLIVAYGTAETPEFQRQSRELAAALEEAGKSAALVVAEGYNHYEIAEDFGHPYGPLGRAILEQMSLGTS
ncbi:MAG TPA: alpha/beta hydrolase [Gammaproteobacteria bacterium]|nr:alpha/beta hydrolase [Gammaproteobacteria bacterium]